MDGIEWIRIIEEMHNVEKLCTYLCRYIFQNKGFFALNFASLYGTFIFLDFFLLISK